MINRCRDFSTRSFFNQFSPVRRKLGLCSKTLLLLTLVMLFQLPTQSLMKFRSKPGLLFIGKTYSFSCLFFHLCSFGPTQVYESLQMSLSSEKPVSAIAELLLKMLVALLLHLFSNLTSFSVTDLELVCNP